MTSSGNPSFSIITTCKGRLDDLKQSLPRFMRQADTEVIVVDYDCPQHCGEYVEREFPSAKLVRVADRPMFNLPDARNHGAKLASGKMLAFLDADVLIEDNYIERIGFEPAEQCFGTFDPRTGIGNSVRGSCVIRRKDFDALGGYDEMLSGWEGEDLDMYTRLRILGARRRALDIGGVHTVIEQSTEERMRYRPNEEKKKQFLRGQLYQMAKETLMRSRGLKVVALDQRKAIMAKIDAQIDRVYDGEKDFELTLVFPDKYVRGMLKDWEFATSVSVYARRKPKD